MYHIQGMEQLKARIQVLEQQRASEWKGMKSHVSGQYERLKPANLIRNAFGGLSETIDPDSDILNEGAAMLSGMVVNSIMSGSKNKPLKKWLTLVLFSVAAYFITKHREEIVAAGNKVVDYVADRLSHIKHKGSKKAEHKEEEEEEEEEEEIPDIPPTP